MSEVAKQTVVYEMPGTDAVGVRRDLEYESSDRTLLMDLYDPPDMEAGERNPAVVIVAGYPDPGMEQVMGCKFKEMGQSVSWAKLMAASGMVAITYTNRDPAPDLHALLQHLARNGTELGIDPDRIGLWACSGNVPLALSALMQRRTACAVLCYGFMLDLEGSTSVADAARTFGFANPGAGKSLADLPSDLPLFIARAGRDEMPGLNTSIDRFVTDASSHNLPLTVANHASGPHAFDLSDPGEASRAIIRQILTFLRAHLGR